MIGAVFKLGGESIEVRIIGAKVLFRTSSYGTQFADIRGLRLSKTGCLIDNPDLEHHPQWKTEVIKRFKEKIKKMKDDEERLDYVIDELRKFGYKPMYKAREGHRPRLIK